MLVFCRSLAWYFVAFVLSHFAFHYICGGTICLVLILLFGACDIAREGARRRACFVYGCVGVFVFVPHFDSMVSSTLWLSGSEPSLWRFILLWSGSVVALGGGCAFMAGWDSAESGSRIDPEG